MEKVLTFWIFLSLCLFFCWRLLGLIPGGAPFSQRSSGVKDAMVVFTRLVNCHFMTKTCKRPLKQHTKQKGSETGNRPQKVPRLQKRAQLLFPLSLKFYTWSRVNLASSCTHPQLQNRLSPSTRQIRKKHEKWRTSDYQIGKPETATKMESPTISF